MRKTTIAEACTLHARIGWQGLTKKEYLDEGDYYLVTGVDFDNGHIAFDSCHYVTKDRYDQDQHIQLHMDDILVTKDGTIGKVAIIDEPIDKPATLNSGVFVVRPKDKATLLPKYLMYVLQSNNFNSFIERIKVGCTIAHLNQEKFYQFEFPLPPVDDQEKIIKVFDTMFSVLYARKLEIQKLDELIKARFVELFGNPFDNEKWDICELKDISESMIDGSNVDPKYYDSEGDVLFLRIQNVWRNEFRLDDSVYISREINNNNYYDTSLKTGDLLITKIGRFYTKDSSLGRVSVYRGEDDCANYSNNIMRVRLIDSMNSEFVNALLNLDDYQKYIKRTSKGGTDKRALSKSLIGSYPIGRDKQVDKSKVV
ncbi:restriction endonuclease subunit S [Butyrivibrio sp. TB]|uniref:restriction endonuclease subunit S n=1 Tax=Butyrivibrio sp. TB TaxID=1520809 RepID=UPI0008B22468|nr:restriction endonuclease subunit S [Butyrivibrio sp. TB]SEQ43146.1 Type I restriction modification DNA specificity domain-containing protein [Butyrivibrio sp. TB]